MSVHAQSPRQVECCAELKTATPPGAKRRNPVIPIPLAKCRPEPDGRGHDGAIKPSSNTDRRATAVPEARWAQGRTHWEGLSVWPQFSAPADWGEPGCALRAGAHPCQAR